MSNSFVLTRFLGFLSPSEGSGQPLLCMMSARGQNSTLNTHIKKQASLFAVQRRTSTVCLLSSAWGEQPVDCSPITFHFLEKADSCSRCGPPSCCPLSAICSLQPSPFPNVPQFLLTCDHSVHLPSLTVCFMSLPSTSSNFPPSPPCSLFPSLLLLCSTFSGPPPASPGSHVSLASPSPWPFLPSALSLHLQADVADTWQRATGGATPASKKGICHLGSKPPKTEGRKQAFVTTAQTEDQISCSSEGKRGYY